MEHTVISILLYCTVQSDAQATEAGEAGQGDPHQAISNTALGKISIYRWAERLAFSARNKVNYLQTGLQLLVLPL
jgi:hypothetical protein